MRESPYDVGMKLGEYQLRGDAEIWLIHPYRRLVTAWRLEPAGRYTEMTLAGGAVPLHAVPDVTIDLDRLFR